MKLYPLKFKPIHRHKVWGGQKLSELYERSLPRQAIGESWEISDRPEADTEVINGELKGITLSKLIDSAGEKVLGRSYSSGEMPARFPLLFKILTPEDRLSVQVHPDDEMARRLSGASGKTEMWYVLESEPGAEIICGLIRRDISPEEIVERAGAGELEEYLNYRRITAGDVIFLPPGLIHAALPGSVLAEIQQNSDTTYRLYDWNRDRQGTSRPLHLKEAAEVMRPDLDPEPEQFSPRWQKGDAFWRLLASCQHFSSFNLQLEGSEIVQPRELGTFLIIFCAGGSFTLHCRHQKYSLEKGQNCLLPASLPEVRLEGRGELLIFRDGLAENEVRDLLKDKKIPPEKLVSIPGMKERL